MRNKNNPKAEIDVMLEDILFSPSIGSLDFIYDRAEKFGYTIVKSEKVTDLKTGNEHTIYYLYRSRYPMWATISEIRSNSWEYHHYDHYPSIEEIKRYLFSDD